MQANLIGLAKTKYEKETHKKNENLILNLRLFYWKIFTIFV